jgi:hypothetical protein
VWQWWWGFEVGTCVFFKLIFFGRMRCLGRRGLGTSECGCGRVVPLERAEQGGHFDTIFRCGVAVWHWWGFEVNTCFFFLKIIFLGGCGAWGDGGRVQVSVAVNGWYRWKERSRAVILVVVSSAEWQCGGGCATPQFTYRFLLQTLIFNLQFPIQKPPLTTLQKPKHSPKFPQNHLQNPSKPPI